MKDLFNFHYDFIKIKVPNVEESKIKWHNLIEHPNLRRHYCLKPNADLQYHKNFDMFLSKAGDVVIRTSMPYLVYGHNFTSFDIDDTLCCMGALDETLGIDFQDAFVLEYEYGCFEQIETPCKQYIDNINGLEGYELVKSTNYMKMFDNRKGIKYKIYDAVVNAKRKKTFTRGGYSSDRVIKHEFKYVGREAEHDLFPIRWFITNELDQENRKTLLLLIKSQLKVLEGKDRFIKAKSLTDILFITLKVNEQLFGMSTNQFVKKTINQLDLSPSQKSKRLKSLKHLEQLYSIPDLQEITI
jgi:hypothetical protein